MRIIDLYDFAPILNNSTHTRKVNLYIFADVDSINSLNF